MIKKYITPELEERFISVNDIIQVSQENNPTTLKTAVNGKEGLDYGAQEVSLLD